MSKQPECIKCGNYILHGNVVCQDCLPDHDADIIRKAREEYEAQVKEFIDSAHACPLDYVTCERIKKYMISVRSTTPQSGQEQPR